MTHRRARPSATALFAVLLLAPAAGADPPDPGETGNWAVETLAAPVEAFRAGDPEIELILDDGSREADIGFTDVTAFQFLWFNRFDPPFPGIDLREIQVLFPPGPDVAPGGAVQLVVYRDDDGDPSNGAELLLAFDDVIQVVDGTSFSVYPVDPPLRLLGGGDILIGVVNRYVNSGVSPPSRPAALDTTTSEGRSWVALWADDPPPMPELPPDLFLDTIDFLEPGNWLIRASGTEVPITAVPTLSRLGLAALALFVALAGAWVLARRTGVSRTSR
ncbi:MAG: IPTL-CTERM sorting domain-containing protein [bacterium]|nr:IPTL-CTERM sorting domain-containing protein [bacterium]